MENEAQEIHGVKDPGIVTGFDVRVLRTESENDVLEGDIYAGGNGCLDRELAAACNRSGKRADRGHDQAADLDLEAH